MNRNISQPQFEGMAPALPSFSVQGDNPKHAPSNYGGGNAAHTTRFGARMDMENPLPRTTGRGIPFSYAAHHEWVPSERVVSNQPHVTSGAVEHITQHGNILDLDEDPYFEPNTVGEYAVRDGNHRVNAALRQGRLFMPGVVFRDRLPDEPQDLRGRLR